MGLPAFPKVAHDLLLTYYVGSQEAQELFRSFNEKVDPNDESFYK